MVNVMLVDDEPIEREGLKLILNNNRPEVKIVAEATDGLEAIELAFKHKPAIIFMDIKMPNMDGVTAVKKILAKLPQTKCIMVTAFDTFEYAQAVMKYGVKEYLLKPSKVSRVLEALDLMVEEYKNEQKKEQEQLELYQRIRKTASIVESEFIMSLMLDYVHDHRFEESSNWLDLKKEVGFATIFSFEFEDIFIEVETETEWYSQLKDILHNYNKSIIVGPLMGLQVPVYVINPDNDSGSDDYKERITRSVVQQFQKKNKKVKLIAGVGGTITNIEQFSSSYAEATAALEAVYSNPGSSYLVFHQNLVTHSDDNLIDLERRLFEVVKTGDRQKGLQQFDSYFQLISNIHNQQLEQIKKRIDLFFNVLIRELKDFGIREVYESTLYLLSSPVQVKETARSRLDSMIKHVSDWRKGELKGVLAQARNYINQYFYQQSISLDMVAKHVGVSPHYLSKLYKEHFGQSFIEHLTNVRLKHAKEYLLDPNKPLKEIARLIGYKDPNYFSRVFKKNEKMNPSEWRDHHQ